MEMIDQPARENHTVTLPKGLMYWHSVLMQIGSPSASLLLE